MAILWRNPRDPVRVPDVRVDLAFDELELVELANDFAPVFHHEMSGFPESVGIAKAQRSGTVAGDQLLRRASHAPSFSRVRELLYELQAESVVDKTHMRLPRPLVDIRTPIDDSLAEVFGREIM